MMKLHEFPHGSHTRDFNSFLLLTTEAKLTLALRTDIKT